MKIKTPTIKELSEALADIKAEICNDYIADDDTLPGIDITLACGENGYAMQTGDNSYSGAAYSFQHWGVARLYRRSNSRNIARELIEQCKDLASY